MALNLVLDIIEVNVRWSEQTALELQELKETKKSKANSQRGDDIYAKLHSRCRALIDRFPEQGP